MIIEALKIENYKSYFAGPDLSLSTGFNVIVGQNNAGKSALMEALSMRTGSVPHKSLRTLPKRGEVSDKVSRVIVRATVRGEEMLDAFERTPLLYLPLGNEDRTRLLQQYSAVTKEDSVKLDFTWQMGQGLESAKLADIPYPGLRSGIQVRYSVGGFADQSGGGSSSGWQLSQSPAGLLAVKLQERTYVFRAERLKLGESGAADNGVLATDASNLPQVLHFLQTSNTHRFKRLNDALRIVFPQVTQITVPPIENSRVRVLVWSIDPTTEREDLALPLSESGTGLGQVLAILYVVITANAPMILGIDEPQSFLHPGAVRKLFEILRSHSEHQYIITTHSPVVITSAQPDSIVLLRQVDGVTEGTRIDPAAYADMNTVLSEVGARLADVFGADDVLWVEGRSEELCFPMILSELTNVQLLGTVIIGVQHTSDFDAGYAMTAVEVYKRLATGSALRPPAIGFIFDGEGKSESEKAEVSKIGGSEVSFLPRRMLENYLLNSEAITALLNELDVGKQAPYDPVQVTGWAQTHGAESKYAGKAKLVPWSAAWLANVHAAKLLSDMISALSETRVTFDKVRDNPKLTRWILDNKPEELRELATILERTIAGRRQNPN